MPDELLASVEQHLKTHLASMGFSRRDYLYMPEHFGDSYILFASSHYWFYFSKDKGQIFTEVGPIDSPPSIYLYFDLWYVAEFLHHSDFPRDYSGSTDEQVARIARYMLAHWGEIFTPDLLVNRADELRAHIQKCQRDRMSPSPDDSTDSHRG